MTKVCARCGKVSPDESAVCAACGHAPNTSEPVHEFREPDQQPPEPSSLAQIDDKPAYIGNDELTGIGGWLILTAIQLTVGPIVLAFGICVDLRFLVYGLGMSRGLGVLILTEAITNTIMLLALIGLNVLFYRKQRQFPRWMITYLVAGFVISLCDHIGAMLFAPSSEWLSVFRALIIMLLWVPYFLQSQRVEQTFVN